MFNPFQTDDDKEKFGTHWCGPDQYEHFKRVLVAKYPKDPSDGDGYDVEIYCIACPARFYKIKALSSKNGIGKKMLGFTLRTGSSCRELAIQIAEAISTGMLSIGED